MFTIDWNLLEGARDVLSAYRGISWILGGAGSGKSTICAELSRGLGIPVYDMDEHIYGSYFPRYLPDRHPANTAWAAAPDPLSWLLDMSRDEFDAYHRAAAAEYLDLFAEDVAEGDPGHRLLVDGGLYHPEVLAQVLPSDRIVCLAAPHLDSRAVWTGSDERLAMRDMMAHHRDPEGAWRSFLDFDSMMTETIAAQAPAVKAALICRSPNDEVSEVAARVAAALGLQEGAPFRPA